MTRLSRLVQPLKVSGETVARDFPSLTLFNPVQFWNAPRLLPEYEVLIPQLLLMYMFFTESGITNSSKDVQSSKAA